MKRTVSIIGAGPAGISSAIQLKRYDIDFYFFEKSHIGGLLRNAYLIENYLGFPYGLSGSSLINLISKQIADIKKDIIFEEVLKVNSNNNEFEIQTAKSIYSSKYCIVASGTIPIKLSEDICQANKNNRVFYEISECSEIHNSTFTIIGCGDAAFDYALNLSNRDNSIKILCRGLKSKALPILIERAEAKKNIEIIYNIEVSQIYLKETEVLLTCFDGSIIASDYLVAAIGRKPALDFIDKSLFSEQVSSKNFYIIGDAKNENFRQISIASGDGIRAAMDIYFKILGDKH